MPPLSTRTAQAPQLRTLFGHGKHISCFTFLHCEQAVRSLQQQWLLPKNDASTTSLSGSEDNSPITLPSLFHHRRISTMAVQHLSLPYQRGLSPSPHRTSPRALLLVSAGLQKGWLHKHAPPPPRLPFVLSASSRA